MPESRSDPTHADRPDAADTHTSAPGLRSSTALLALLGASAVVTPGLWLALWASASAFLGQGTTALVCCFAGIVLAITCGEWVAWNALPASWKVNRVFGIAHLATALAVVVVSRALGAASGMSASPGAAHSLLCVLGAALAFLPAGTAAGVAMAAQSKRRGVRSATLAGCDALVCLCGALGFVLALGIALCGGGIVSTGRTALALAAALGLAGLAIESPRRHSGNAGSEPAGKPGGLPSDAGSGRLLAICWIPAFAVGICLPAWAVVFTCAAGPSLTSRLLLPTALLLGAAAGFGSAQRIATKKVDRFSAILLSSVALMVSLALSAVVAGRLPAATALGLRSLSARPARTMVVAFAAAMGLTLLPSGAFAATFALGVPPAGPDRAEPGAAAGRIRTAGLAMAALGALLSLELAGGRLGVRGILLLSLLIQSVSAALLILAYPEAKRSSRIAGAVLIATAALSVCVRIGPWNPLLLATGPYSLPPRFFEKRALASYAIASGNHIEFAHLDRQPGVALVSDGHGTLHLRVYGKEVMDSEEERFAGRLQALLAMLLQPNAGKVCIMGPDLGYIVSALSLHPGQPQLHWVAPTSALRPARLRSAKLLGLEVQQESLTTHAAPPGKYARLPRNAGAYDALLVSSVTPRLYPAEGLATFEFWRDASRLLADGGMVCVRLDARRMDAAQFKTVVRTLMAVFPNTTLWQCERRQYLLIAWRGRAGIDPDLAVMRNADGGLRSLMSSFSLEAPEDLYAYYVYSATELADFCSSAHSHSVGRPYRDFLFMEAATARASPLGLMPEAVLQQARQAQPAYSPAFSSRPPGVKAEVDPEIARLQSKLREKRGVLPAALAVPWLADTEDRRKAALSINVKALPILRARQQVLCGQEFADNAERELAFQAFESAVHLNGRDRLAARMAARANQEQGKILFTRIFLEARAGTANRSVCERCAEYMQRALELDARATPAATDLATCLILLRRHAQAEAVLKKELEHRNVSAYCLLAELYLKAGRQSEALTLLEAAVRLNPDYVPAYRTLALYYEKCRMWPEAIECWESVRHMSILENERRRAVQAVARCELILESGGD